MASIDYIGFDIHKTLTFCTKAQDGSIVHEATIAALDRGDGSDAVYGMGLRYSEAFCTGVAGSTPGDVEGYRSTRRRSRIAHGAM